MAGTRRRTRCDWCNNFFHVQDNEEVIRISISRKFDILKQLFCSVDCAISYFTDYEQRKEKMKQ